MKIFLSSTLPFILCCLFLQPKNAPVQPVISPEYVVKAAAAGLFDSDEVLRIKLSGNIRSLFNDRGDKVSYHPLVLTYKGADSNEVAINLRAKTRGNFRRSRDNCVTPPILLNFTKKPGDATIFSEQDKLKLVTACRTDDYVIHEYLVYKLYNLLTPKSYRARLAYVTFYDTERKKETSFYGMLLEEDAQMAKRNGTKLLDRKMINGENTETETFLKMAVFQYMIGNTDWSVPYLHNIRILSFDASTVPSVVPYDFDHAGIVDAPYAMPAPELGLKSVRERRYRGYCITDMKTFSEVIATYNRLKNDIYNVYTSCKLLDAKYVRNTSKYLDDFYETINNPKKLKSEFTYPCTTHNNVVIQGLDN